MNKKIKIVQFVEAFGGGVYTYVKDLCNFLVQTDQFNECEVHLIYSPNRVEFDRELFRSEIDPMVVQHQLDMCREINIKQDIGIIRETRNVLKRINPDILHLHSSKASVIGRLASVGIIKRKNMYYSPHGYAFMQQNIPSWKKKFYQIVEFTMPKIFGGLTIASGETEYMMSVSFTRSLLIRNGVNFDLPQKIYSPIKNKRLVIGTIGRLTPQKNPALFNKIAEAIPEADFIWIGNGELEYEIKSPNITITGWIRTRQELLSKLNELDVYLQVSLWEGLPIALIEAMAMKKPLIVSNIIGNKDCVDEGYNGYVFNSKEEAVEQIRSLNVESKILLMGQNSFDKAFKEYHKENNFHKLVDLYLNTLDIKKYPPIQ